MKRPPITKGDLTHGIELRKLAIADAEARISTNPTDTRYVAQQQAKIESWQAEMTEMARKVSARDYCEGCGSAPCMKHDD